MRDDPRPAGRVMADQVSRSGEPGDACDTDDQTVDREGSQSAGLEVPGQEPDRKVGGDPGGDAADKDLTADAVAGAAGEGGQLEDSGGEDDRGREEEGEPCGLLVVEASPEAGDHGDARPADAGEQSKDLRAADLEGVARGDGPG